MTIYKLSSQFTDYVLENYKPDSANNIFDQVAEAFQVKSQNDPKNNIWSMLGAFHGPKGKTDEQMLETLEGTDNNKKRQLNLMYEVLKGLESTGRIDKVVRRILENFVTKQWAPQTVAKTETPKQPGEIRSGVVKGRVRERPLPESLLESLDEIEEPENIPRHMREQEMMNRRVQRSLDEQGKSELQKLKQQAEAADKWASCIFDLFITAGILETVPDIKEREARLAERAFAWTALLPES